MIFKSKRKAFEHSVKPHLAHLYRLAYRLCGAKSDAEDLVQDLVLKIYRGSSDLSGLDNPKTWLSKALYRLFIDFYRQKARSPIIHIVPEDSEFQSSTIDDSEEQALNPLNDIEQQQFLQVIDNSLKEMGEDYRILVIMYEIEGYTLEEISEILDIPVGTLKSRLHRARKKLRNLIEAGTKWRAVACSKQGNEK